MPRLLMAPPQHYGVLYEINPWMNRGRATDPARAAAQWSALRALLAGPLEAEVQIVEPVEGLPDLVFTANAGLVREGRVVVSNFRHPERQGEAAVFARWFAEHGYDVLRPPEGRFFEGEGDALFVGDTLYAGYRFRSDAHSHALLADLLGVRVLPLELVDPRFYHLDTCFCPLDAETVAYFPPAFDRYARRVIAANIPNRIEVSEAEAARFACNAVVLNGCVALIEGCPRFEEQLRERGLTPHATPLGEFLKAGGSAKCLTLHLDRASDDGSTRKE